VTVRADDIGVSRHVVENGIVEIRLERPKARNALRLADKRAVARLIREAAEHCDARVIVLSGGESTGFCAGTDIKEMSGFSVADGIRMLKAEAQMYDAVMASPLPVVAAVRGAAFGAGCVLACCCDITVAAPSAVFAMPEVRNGVPAPVQAALIPRILGLGVAKSMLYRLKRLGADEAHRLGLVDEIVPDDDLFDNAVLIAREMASLPAETLALQKEIVGAWIRDPFDAAVESSTYIAASAFAGGVPQAAIDAFLRSRHDVHSAGDGEGA
jgi:enoyl-CoA hydratase/carnithine racemase